MNDTTWKKKNLNKSNSYSGYTKLQCLKKNIKTQHKNVKNKLRYEL